MAQAKSYRNARSCELPGNSDFDRVQILAYDTMEKNDETNRERRYTSKAVRNG